MRLLLLLGAFACVAAQKLPVPKIYGVNLGNWLVSEPWMSPNEWLAMGGESCDDCSTCIGSEFALVKSNPSGADAIFQKHWDTWFNQPDIDQMVAAGLNTVRIPLGYWLVESLVDRKTEFYPRGGIKALKRGLRQLKQAGIHAILDHHALPGVSSSNQMFAGLCTTDVQFYTPANYERALTWAAVMTAVAHLDPDFSNAFAIQAINEPIMDASQTPGLGDYEKNFVLTVRAIENALGIFVPGQPPLGASSSLNATLSSLAANATSDPVRNALLAAIPAFAQTALEIGLLPTLRATNRSPLFTNFMDMTWQHNGEANPADAARGPQAYDDHLYFNFGGVADPNEDAYLTTLCNLKRAQTDVSLGNTPMWFGEWSVATNFDATDAFMVKWADAQKLIYARGTAGWIFWSFKIEDGSSDQRQWDYFEALRRGYFTKDPTAFNNASVCDPYVTAT